MTHYSRLTPGFVNTKKQTCPGEYNSKASHSPLGMRAWVIGEKAWEDLRAEIRNLLESGQSSYSWEKPGNWQKQGGFYGKVSGGSAVGSVMGRVPPQWENLTLWNSEKGGILTADWQPSSPHATWVGGRREINRNSEENPHRLLPFPTIRALKGFTMISQRGSPGPGYTAECENAEGW